MSEEQMQQQPEQEAKMQTLDATNETSVNTPTVDGIVSQSKEDLAMKDNADTVASTEKEENLMADSQTNTTPDANDIDENTPFWDHSDRRVMLQGVNKYMDTKKAVKVAQELIDNFHKNQNDSETIKIVFDKVKKPPRESWMTITFSQVDMVQPFIDYINSTSRRDKHGNKLFAKMPSNNQTNNNMTEKKRKVEGDDNSRGKRQARSGSDLKMESRRPVSLDEVKAKICPLWNMSPEEQLKQKLRDMIKKSCIKIVQEIKAKFRTLEKSNSKKFPLYHWLTQKRCIETGPVIAVPSPIRNKVEFTFGYRYLFDKSTTATEQDAKDTEDSVTLSTNAEPPKVPAVGFMVLGWAGGVSRPHGCPNIGTEFCALADLMDDFLKDSPLPPYDSSVHTGCWRFLTIRASRRTRECMVIITHSPSSGGRGDEAQEETDWSVHVEPEKARLLHLLQNAQLPVPDQEPIRITSIYFQEFGGLSNPTPDTPVQLVHGKETLEERLGKCIFHISPGAFFQVNTVGAEILYQKVVEKVREVSPDPQNTLLFDVCCGTGTIGLTCMKEGVVGKIVGIDISGPAIEDAKRNAQANGYSNDDSSAGATRFVASRAEHVMMKEIAKAEKLSSAMKFVAVVDPARDGLHADVVRALRACGKISRIVYVSCNPTGSLIKDAALLCCPPTKKYTGKPFRIESAKPVDMFPLTLHCEMVMAFDRATEQDLVGPKWTDGKQKTEQLASISDKKVEKMDNDHNDEKATASSDDKIEGGET